MVTASLRSRGLGTRHDPAVTTSVFSSTVWNSDLGEFINEDHVRMHEMLEAYHPGRYSLVYIPKAQRLSAQDVARPWAILERQASGAMEPIRYLSEQDMTDPPAVLAWVFNGDLIKHRPGDVWARIENEEDIRRAMDAQRERDRRAAEQEYAAFLAKGGRDKKHTVRLGQGRKLER